MNYKIFTILVLLLLCTSPVAASVTYSEEYYQINEQLNKIPDYNRVATIINGFNMNVTFWDGVYYLQMEKQNILLEKQNELQAELIKAQWVETCYAPHTVYTVSFINHSAWKSECANAGYPVG